MLSTNSAGLPVSRPPECKPTYCAKPSLWRPVLGYREPE
jgi:hypothetical protein